jgi:hypothetical protein
LREAQLHSFIAAAGGTSFARAARNFISGAAASSLPPLRAALHLREAQLHPFIAALQGGTSFARSARNLIPPLFPSFAS